MDNISESEKWIEFAENDYQAAVLLSKNVKPLLEIVCFHCQQCAEKYLKAFIIKNNSEIKLTHNLEELLKICVKIPDDFEFLKDNCIDLTDSAVETRYPYPFEINLDDMNKALKDMEAIRSFVRSKIKH